MDGDDDGEVVVTVAVDGAGKRGLRRPNGEGDSGEAKQIVAHRFADEESIFVAFDGRWLTSIDQ